LVPQPPPPPLQRWCWCGSAPLGRAPLHSVSCCGEGMPSPCTQYTQLEAKHSRCWIWPRGKRDSICCQLAQGLVEKNIRVRRVDRSAYAKPPICQNAPAPLAVDEQELVVRHTTRSSMRLQYFTGAPLVRGHVWTANGRNFTFFYPLPPVYQI
jgi:hypothetical protein